MSFLLISHLPRLASWEWGTAVADRPTVTTQICIYYRLILSSSYPDITSGCCIQYIISVNVIRSIWSLFVMWQECRFLYIEIDGSKPGISILCP